MPHYMSRLMAAAKQEHNPAPKASEVGSFAEKPLALLYRGYCRWLPPVKVSSDAIAVHVLAWAPFQEVEHYSPCCYQKAQACLLKSWETINHYVRAGKTFTLHKMSMLCARFPGRINDNRNPVNSSGSLQLLAGLKQLNGGHLTTDTQDQLVSLCFRTKFLRRYPPPLQYQRWSSRSFMHKIGLQDQDWSDNLEMRLLLQEVFDRACQIGRSFRRGSERKLDAASGTSSRRAYRGKTYCWCRPNTSLKILNSLASCAKVWYGFAFS